MVWLLELVVLLQAQMLQAHMVLARELLSEVFFPVVAVFCSRL
jgi:hypothetical protein